MPQHIHFDSLNFILKLQKFYHNYVFKYIIQNLNVHLVVAGDEYIVSNSNIHVLYTYVKYPKRARNISQLPNMVS